jgi:hypothetical protein
MSKKQIISKIKKLVKEYKSLNESEYLPKKEVQAIKKWVYDNGYDAGVVMLSDLWDSKKELIKRILDDVPERDHKEMIAGLKKAGLYESVNEAKSTKKGDTYYVDSDFVNRSKKGGNLKHLGMGDFAVDVDGGGTISFHRVSEKIPGFSGRTHRVSGSDADFKKLSDLMGVTSESVNEASWNPYPTYRFKGSTSKMHDIQKEFAINGIEYSLDLSNREFTVKGDEKKIAKIVKSHGGTLVESVNEASNFAGWIAGFNGKKVEIKKGEAKDLWGAKQLAAKQLKVPKSKMGLLWIKPAVDESVNEDEQLDEKLITFSNRAPYGQVVFMAGGAGSGKGFAISNFIDSAGFRVRDVDEMKTQVGKLEKLGKISVDTWYKKFSGNLAPEEREHVEKWVINKGLTISDIADDLKDPNNVASLHYIVDAMGIKDKWLINMLAGKSNPETLPNLLFDITAKNIKSIVKVIKPLLAKGYKPKNIHLVWVLTNYHIAVEQNRNRARVVPDDILLLTHEGAAKTIWSIVTGALPSGMDGRIDVILGGEKNTINYEDSKGKKLKGAVKGFTTLPVKKAGGGILPEKVWLNKLYKWVVDNTPKTIDLRKPLDTQMEALKEALKANDPKRKVRKKVSKKHRRRDDKKIVKKALKNEAKLSPSKQKELDALIDEFKQATDPENEYIDGGYGRYRDENEILRDIEKKFGKSIASQVSAISHYPRHGISRDKLAFKQQWYGQPKRITKKGKMHKQDIQKMKNYYKRGY